MTKRLFYYVETFGLLPNTQFGGLTGPDEQALLGLANAIDQAWLKGRVVMLAVFDLKGAFNGVDNTLDARLKERGIPTAARKWVKSLMEERSASIKFDGFETETASLGNVG